MEGAAGGLEDYLDLAVRAYTLRADRQGSEDEVDRPRRGRQERVPPSLLILDTETTTDRSQRLLFGCWRYVRVEDRTGPSLTLHTVEEGLFYPDDLASWNPVGAEHPRGLRRSLARSRGRVRSATRPHRLKLVPLSGFLSGQLWRAGYELRAGVVCFNWSFDLSRLAWHAGTSRQQVSEAPRSDRRWLLPRPLEAARSRRAKAEPIPPRHRHQDDRLEASLEGVSLAGAGGRGEPRRRRCRRRRHLSAFAAISSTSAPLPSRSPTALTAWSRPATRSAFRTRSAKSSTGRSRPSTSSTAARTSAPPRRSARRRCGSSCAIP